MKARRTLGMLAIMIMVVSLVISTLACGTATPTVLSTYTPYPTYTSVPITETAVPTWTPKPTHTPVPTIPSISGINWNVSGLKRIGLTKSDTISLDCNAGGVMYDNGDFDNMAVVEICNEGRLIVVTQETPLGGNTFAKIMLALGFPADSITAIANRGFGYFCNEIVCYSLAEQEYSPGFYTVVFDLVLLPISGGSS
jgi:hypothetical protein